MEGLILLIAAIVVIALATAIAPRLGIAGPLVLVLIGAAVSILPFVSVPEIDPEWILVGVLPPLLYSAAVALPAIEFRRDFRPIAGLAFLLVLLSSMALGAFFLAVIPGIHPAIAVALGAILSPTDAVATTIVKRLGVSRRVVTMLEGESLLNDATALVLMRTMVAAAAVAATASVADTDIGVGFLPAFLWGVLVALVVGGVVGYLNLRLRALIGHSAANTAVGLVVPFVAYLPTEALGGSGLVAAVVAGIVTGQGSARWFTPEQRRSDEHNWRTVELVLEGAVFLIMGLELEQIVRGNIEDHNGLGTGLGIAAGALAIIIGVRAAYVSALVWVQDRAARNRRSGRLDAIGEPVEDVAAGRADPARRGDTRRSRTGPHEGAGGQRRLESLRARFARTRNALDAERASPLGWKHGVVIVWAGMRGVVTLAAAQTLSDETTDDRALLVFIAFSVAMGSLLLQGFTLPWLVRALKLETSHPGRVDPAEQAALDSELRQAAASALSRHGLRRRDGSAFPDALVQGVGARLVEPPDDETTSRARDVLELRLAMVRAMRARLNELSSGGGYSTPALRHALAELDADQLSLELRLRSQD